MLTLLVRERSPEISCAPSTQEVTVAWLERLLAGQHQESELLGSFSKTLSDEELSAG